MSRRCLLLLLRLIVSLFCQIVFVQIAILGGIITGDVFALDGGDRDDLRSDAFTQGPLTPAIRISFSLPYEGRMTLQPFLQDVVDVRLAEFPVTSQFAMPGLG